jgi:hypothetical protein
MGTSIPRVREYVTGEDGPGGLLEKLGVDGIIVAREFPLPEPLPDEWKLAHSEWEGDVYHRAASLPHIRALEGQAGIRVIENSRHRVVADVTPETGARRVLLTFSRPYFPGYRAELNGRPVPVSSFRGLTPTVEIPAGESGRLTLVYRPWPAVFGGAMAAASAGAALLLFVCLRTKPKARQR